MRRFCVTKHQQEIIETAIEAAYGQTVTPSKVEGSVKSDSSTNPYKSGLARNNKPTNSQQRAAAITKIAECFLDRTDNENVTVESYKNLQNKADLV